MHESMREVTSVLSDSQIDTIGFIMGYNEKGIFVHPDQRREEFAETGVETHINFLALTVEDALIHDKDVRESVRREYLDRDGIGFTLMRTHLGDGVERSIVALNAHDFDIGRARILEDEYAHGACPAILKTPSADDPTVQRPIAFEYAWVALEHMPKAFFGA